MVNALVITNNIHFIKKLFDDINIHYLDIRITGVATSKLETLKSLKTLDFDIIFLDAAMKGDYNNDFIMTYKDIIVPLTYNQSFNLVTKKQLDRIISLIDINDNERRKSKVIRELEYIGYNFKYKGTHYLLESVLQMYSRKHSMVDNLQTTIYPIIAEKYNKTIYNIKSSISKATDCMYCECDSRKLANYFKFSYDIKPTVKQVIFTIINKI